MRAAMFYEPGHVRMEDVPAPEPGPGEVLVQIGAALTCGTDVKTYNRGHPTLFKELPSPFGHKFGGTIEVVGEGVEGWRPYRDLGRGPLWWRAWDAPGRCARR